MQLEFPFEPEDSEVLKRAYYEWSFGKGTKGNYSFLTNTSWGEIKRIIAETNKDQYKYPDAAVYRAVPPMEAKARGMWK